MNDTTERKRLQVGHVRLKQTQIADEVEAVSLEILRRLSERVDDAESQDLIDMLTLPITMLARLSRAGN